MHPNRSTHAPSRRCWSAAGGYADSTGPDSLFSTPSGIDTDGTNLFITDAGSNLRIRKLGVGQPIPAVPPAALAPYPSVGVSQAEIPGGSALAESCACSQGSGADPVNTGNGDYYETVTDLQTPGRGPGLNVTRTYDSFLAGQDGLFGYGWSSSYGIFLTVDPSTHDVTVHQEDGSTVAFHQDAAGNYSPLQPRMQATFAVHADGTFTFIRHKRTTYTFNSAGRLTTITDLNGYSTTLAYDTNNHLASVTDSASRTYTVTTAGGRITKISDPAARTYLYGYSTAGDLTSVTDPTGAVTTFTYDSAHRLLTTLDPNQQAATTKVPLTNAYDTAGRVTSQSDFLGRTTTFQYSSNATVVTDPAGRVTVDYYSNGVRTQTIAGYGTPAAATTTFTYDAATGAVAAVTDPLNHVTTTTYDSRGNILTVTDPLNRVTTNTYDSLNDLLTSTDPLGTTNTQTFDAAGNLLTSSRPLLSATGTTLATRRVTYTYGDAGHPGDVTAVTDPNGNTITNTFDGYGDLLSTTLPATAENSAGNKTSHTYNTNTGWMLTTVSPRGNISGATPATYTTTYGYDSDGRPTSVKDSTWTSATPTAHQSSRTYDGDGNLHTSTDANNHTTTYIYDADNELTATTQPNGTTQTHQTWNADGQILTTTDGLGNVTTNTYDARGNLLTTQTPNNRTTTYAYDLAGNITSETQPGAICTGTGSPTSGCVSYLYDADNELTSRSYADGATHNVTAITYDADGRKTGQTDATGTSSTRFDSLGRLTSSTDGNAVTISYGYDVAGNETTVTYPGSHTVTYAYDHAERMSSVTDWLSNTVNYTYDPDSDPATTTYPAGTHETDTNTYDQLDRLTAISDTKTVSGTTTTQFAATYTPNSASQIATASTTGITEPNQQYTYNAHDELTTSGTSAATTYSYDAADRITNRGTTSGGAASTQAYNNDSQLCWSKAATIASPTCATVPTGATTYTYNAAGDRTTATPSTGAATTYTYDEEQHLASYTPASGTTTTYKYDGRGLRQSKTTGTTTTHFTWDQSTNLPLLLADGTNSYIYGLDGPVEQINTSTSGVTWLHHDQLGSTRLLTDNTGTTVGTATYDPFGTRTATTGTTTTPLGFDGQYTAAESGLSYLRARYYDPATAQFLTIDPLVVQTGQPYSYSTNDPINSDDPSGLCHGFWGCVGDHGLSILEGGANALTFGGVAALDEKLSPGSTCTYAHDGYYQAGYETAVVATIVATDGASAEAEVAETAASDWPELSGILRDAAKGKGNFGVGSATQEQANAAGQAWVGVSSRLASDGKTLVSQDGLRVYRAPSFKPILGRWQANFESKNPGMGQPYGNGHLDILDPP